MFWIVRKRCQGETFFPKGLYMMFWSGIFHRASSETPDERQNMASFPHSDTTIEIDHLIDLLADIGVSDWEEVELSDNHEGGSENQYIMLIDGYGTDDEEYPIDLNDESEVVKLVQVLEEIEAVHPSGGVSSGGSLICEHYLRDYAREMAHDIHGNKIHYWPMNAIDWDAAGEELTVDWGEVQIDHTVYYVRD